MQVLKDAMVKSQTVNLLHPFWNPILLHLGRSLQKPLAVLAIHETILINIPFGNFLFQRQLEMGSFVGLMEYVEYIGKEIVYKYYEQRREVQPEL